MKYCGGCMSSKPTSFFSSNITGKDGLQSWCKSCKSRQQKEYRKSRVVLELYRKSSAKWILNNREKAMAHNALRCAVRRGEITKLSCQVCGNEKSHGHHSSYDESMWLAVTWLCVSHHRQAHSIYKNVDQ